MIDRNRFNTRAARTTEAPATIRDQTSTRQAYPCDKARHQGFTLIELLVVILIILIVSAVALPTVIPAISHRQVSEGARILQGALVGARDVAIHNNAPSGIRLLPDPSFPLVRLANGTIDPSQPLAANRIVPLQPAPEYSEGLVNVNPPFLSTGNSVPIHNFTSTKPITYPGSSYTYPYAGLDSGGITPITTGNVLMVEESVVDPHTFLPNAPTSWFWNIRIGDKIQINNSGPFYTVVGPMYITPAGTTINSVVYANPEMFVNVGPPGTQSPLQYEPNQTYPLVSPEFLFLVNGQDDNNNGWIDEGWDGVDNNLAYENNNNLTPSIDELIEWEPETWSGSIANHLGSITNPAVSNLPYTIQRRPAPTTNAREVSLPTQVVIDMSTWGFPANNPSLERSRLPVNQYTGYVDILVYPSGTVVPTTIYSSPSSFPLGAAFLHFWVAERSDVYAPASNTVNATNPPYLPLPQGVYPSLFSGIELKGENRLVTLFARTGQVLTVDDMQFDPNASTDIVAGNQYAYVPSYPFLQAQQGVRGGP